MATRKDVEPFPELTPVSSYSSRVNESVGTVHKRRKSSNLRGDPRGDTTGPALATLYDQSPVTTTINSPTSKSEKSGRRSKRRRVKSWFQRWKTYSLKHTWVNPLIVCLLIVAAYAINPSPSNPFHAALFLSYPLARDSKADPSALLLYGKGAKDFAFVGFYTVFLSFTREFVMQRLLRPLASSYGIRSRGKQARFMEQAYTAIYFAIFGPLGLYVMKQTDLWYFNTTAMYEGFPHMTHEALFKAYYLLQASYWAQQMIVLLLMLEKPRKDFKELVAHHIITLSLIWLSYRFHFTHVGIAVYITHDISDFFLATSKVLNYIDAPIVVPYFSFFIGTWIYLRHYLNLRILASLLPLPSPFPDHITGQIHSVFGAASSTAHAAVSPLVALTQPLAAQFSVLFPNTGSIISSSYTTLQPSTFLNGTSAFASIGPYELDWAAQQYKCYISQWITFLLLAALQGVNIFWLFFILRILWRVISSLGEEVADERSEYDSDEEETRRAELLVEKAEEIKGKLVASAKSTAKNSKAANGSAKH